jgi:PAS domain S-box-containing protein
MGLPEATLSGHGPEGRRRGRRLGSQVQRALGLPAAITLLVGLALTALAWGRTHRADEEAARAAFDRRASERAGAVELELERVGGVLEALRAFRAASERVTDAEFALFAALVRSPDVPLQALLRIERRADDTLAIAQAAPGATLAAALGLDPGADPAWRGALALARDTGSFAATGGLGTGPLAGALALHEGVAIVLATYARGVVPADMAVRRAALTGFAVALVQPNAFVEAAVAGFTPDVVTLELLPDSAEVLADSTEAGGVWQRPVVLGAARWQIVARAGARFDEFNARSHAASTLATGCLASLLAAVAVGELVRRARRLREDATRRDADLAVRTHERDAETAARRRAAEALRRSEEELRLLVEGLTDCALFLLAADGTIASWNAGAEHLLGYTRHEVIGLRLDVLYTPEDVANGVPGALLAAAEREGRAMAEVCHVRRDGTRFWVDVALSALHVTDGSLRGFAKLARDVTARRAAEGEIRELNASLERRVEDRTAELAAANRELEAFTYSVSHDLRAPLRAMSGYASMLIEDHGPALDADARRCLDVILRAAAEMSTLIDDLLAFSRLSRQALQREVVDLRALTDEVVRELAPQRAGRLVEIVIGDLPVVRADRSMLKQVLINLVANAQKFTRSREKARIEIGCEPDADEPVFFVRDDGVGFDMRYADALFGVFQRLHSAEEYEGTGVGLALVQRIVLRHGGRVWAESKPEGGATFRFSLGRSRVG